METKKKQYRFLLLPTALFLVLLSGIVAGGWYYYQLQETHFKAKVQDELSAVANLKMEQIAAWRNERLADAELLSKGGLLTSEMAPNEKIRDKFRRIGPLLVIYKKDFGYLSLMVTDIAGRVIENIGDTSCAPLYVDTAAILKVVSEKKTRIVDFYRCPVCGRIHLDVLVPVFAEDTGSAVLGVAVLRRDPQKFLFPLIQSWPTPSRTSETLLFRQEGDRIVYLNELRHKKSTALKLSFSVHDKNLPAARLVRGEQGFIKGIDYRGVPVFACGQHIQDSPWYIVAKVDREEVLAPLRAVLINTIIIGGLGFCAFLLMWYLAYDRRMVLAWSREQMARKQAEDVRQESDERARNIFENTLVGMSITSPDGHAKMNRAFCEMLGYTKDELSNIKWQDLSHADDIKATQDIVELLLAGKENSARFTKRYKKKNGEIIWADVNTVLQKDKNGKPLYFITSVLDITVRRQAEEVLKQGLATAEASRRTLLSVVEDQKQTEEALRLSEEKFAKAFQTSPYAITMTHSEDGSFVEINDAFTIIAGYTREEALADSSIGLKLWVNEEDRQGVVADLRAGKMVNGREYQFRTKSGKMITGLFSAQIIRLGHGPCILSSINDITERKRVEESLRDSENKYRELFDNAEVGMYRSKLDGTAILAANHKLCEIFGCTEAELLGNPAVMRWADAGARNKMIAELRKTGFMKDYEIDIIAKGDEVRTCSVSIKLYPDKGCLEGSAIDITERKQRDMALRESEQKFRDTIKHLDEGYYSCAADGLLFEHNLAFNRILGFDLALDLKGKKLPDFWQNPDDRKEYLNELMSKGFVWSYLIKAKKSGGEKIAVLASAHLIKDEKDRLVKIVGTFTDFTERKRLEEKLLQYNVRLEQKSRDQEQIVYATSHDLRTPLVNVQGFGKELARSVQEITEAIKAENISLATKNKIDPILKKDIPESLSFIQSGITQMDMQLSALLRLSRLGRAAISVEKLDMNTIVREVAKSLEYMVKERGAKIVVSELPFCMADAAQMNQIFLNLIENALKYLDAKRSGVIQISGSSQEREVIYCVEDNGAGIAQEYQEKIFEIFYRVEHGKHLGEGLGLTIVRQCAEKQNGSVWVESEPGKGSRFFVKLPGA
jgi:PAS domain S-box-containing protein